MAELEAILRKGDGSSMSLLFVGGPQDGDTFSGKLQGPVFSVDDDKTDYQVLTYKALLADRSFVYWAAVPYPSKKDVIGLASDILAGHLYRVLVSNDIVPPGGGLFLAFVERPWNSFT